MTTEPVVWKTRFRSHLLFLHVFGHSFARGFHLNRFGTSADGPTMRSWTISEVATCYATGARAPQRWLVILAQAIASERQGSSHAGDCVASAVGDRTRHGASGR